MSTITAKQLHLKTKDVLNDVEAGHALIITRNGKTIGRIEPVASQQPPAWSVIMAEVWAAHKRVKKSEIVPNPVLEERRRRRR
jgi:prevent-host-death family protein